MSIRSIKAGLLCALLLSSTWAVAQVNPYPFPYYGDDIWRQEQGSYLPLAPALVPFVESPTAPLFPDAHHYGADTIIKYNACGREADYATVRIQMNNGNYDHTGSEFASILAAKIAWLNNRSTSYLDCDYTLDVPLDQSQVDSVNNLVHINPEPCVSAVSVTSTHDNFQTAAFVVTPACMRRQVNESILAMKKKGNLGTTGLICDTGGGTTQGDWDQNNRWLVRLLYLGTQTLQASAQFSHPPVLDPQSIEYMESSGMLAAQGALGPDGYPVVMGPCSDFAGDQAGDPQSAEDQAQYSNSLGGDLGKDLKWLLSFFARVFAAEAIGMATGGSPLALAPFVVGSEGNPIPQLAEIIPETENHRLQIESSRFLTNAYFINVLNQAGADASALTGEQQEVANWLQTDLQRIVMTDFTEYNAKDYGTYSLGSLLNLYDFDSINDPFHLQDAAKIVTDLSETKFVAGSNMGRRLVPFRRHDWEDGYTPDPDNVCSLSQTSYMYHHRCSEDAEVVRAVTLTGLVQLVPTRRLASDAYRPCFDPQAGPQTPQSACSTVSQVEPDVLPSLIDIAMSPYTVPDFVEDLAVKRPGGLTQRIKHAGLEFYYQGHSFSVSAGGVPTGAPYGPSTHDRGDALPTVIMATMAGTTVDDVFSFDGVGTAGDRSKNVCAWKGFVCGINAHQKIAKPNRNSYFLQNCQFDKDPNDPTIRFLDSSTCTFIAQPAGAGTIPVYLRAPGPYFFLAERQLACDGVFCDLGQDYGVMEVIDAPWNFGVTPPLPAEAGAHQFPSDYTAFMTSRSAALLSLAFDAEGHATYTDNAGSQVFFVVDRDLPHVLTVNGGPPPGFTTDGDVLGTDGDIIVSDGQGNVTIKSPGTTQHIQINFTVPQNPLWSAYP